jgi:hypothetical protein
MRKNSEKIPKNCKQKIQKILKKFQKKFKKKGKERKILGIFAKRFCLPKNLGNFLKSFYLHKGFLGIF